MTIYKIEIITIQDLEKHHLDVLKDKLESLLYREYNIWINILEIKTIPTF